MMANQIDDKPSLPSHLVRCEYLEATGSQYIDLGYPLGYNNKMVMDVLVITNNTNQFLFGNNTTTGCGFTINLLNNTSGGAGFDGVKYTGNLFRQKRTRYELSKEGVRVDDILYNFNSEPSYFTTDGNIYLLNKNPIPTVNNYFKGKIYSCKIYENDVLIHDYIPCYNTENYRPCMYDVTTGIELYNVGTSEFIYHIADKPIPYLAFEALEDDLQVSITKSATQYSLDRVNWIDLPAEELTEPISKGEKVWFRANITPDGTITGIGTFSCTKMCNLEGTPMSLLYGDRAGDYTHLPNKTYCFTSLFRNNDNIIRVNNPKDFLPAMNLGGNYTYARMFYYCSNLQNSVYLPALELKDQCYQDMFRNCTNLVETFDFVPWTYIGRGCFTSMFAYCLSLEIQPKITYDGVCQYNDTYATMFAYCTSLKQAQKVLPSLIGITSMYNGMYRNTSIRKAPEIEVKEHYNTTYKIGTQFMFDGCFDLVEGPSHIYPDIPTSSEYMFQNCYKLKKSPIIHATGPLFAYCYRYMFNNCMNLDYITALFLEAPNSVTQSHYQWVSNVSPTGTIVLNKNIEWNPEDYRGVNGIPEGWEVKYCDPDNLDDIRDYREIDKAW
jgi:hypothetical protein